MKGVLVPMLLISWTGSGLQALEPPAQSDPLQQLLTLIRPGVDEDPFTTILWQTNLWEARTLAAKEGKPILLWEMDGNPLGCG